MLRQCAQRRVFILEPARALAHLSLLHSSRSIMRKCYRNSPLTLKSAYSNRYLTRCSRAPSLRSTSAASKRAKRGTTFGLFTDARLKKRAAFVNASGRPSAGSQGSTTERAAVCAGRSSGSGPHGRRQHSRHRSQAQEGPCDSPAKDKSTMRLRSKRAPFPLSRESRQGHTREVWNRSKNSQVHQSANLYRRLRKAAKASQPSRTQSWRTDLVPPRTKLGARPPKMAQFAPPAPTWYLPTTILYRPRRQELTQCAAPKSAGQPPERTECVCVQEGKGDVATNA